MANFNIYRDVALFAKAHHGQLPSTSTILAHGESGNYADFTSLNFLIYRVAFAPANIVAQRLLYLLYQLAVLDFGLFLWLRRGGSLGLNRVAVRATALVVASPFVAGAVLVYLDDRAAFGAAPVIALLAFRSPWPRAIAIGAVAAWTGETYFALLVLPLVLAELGGEQRRLAVRSVAGPTAAGLLTALGLTFLLGHRSWELLHNRQVRESSRPFWFSIWRLADGHWTSSARDMIVAVVAVAVVAVAYRHRLPADRAFIALCALLLVASTNTVESRLITLAPLGVILLVEVVDELAYLVGVLVWSAIGLVSLLGHHAVHSFDLLSANKSWSYPVLAVQVLFVNAPLLLVLAVAVVTLARPWQVDSPTAQRTTSRSGSISLDDAE